MLMAAFKKRLEEAHPALWKDVDATIIRALYVRLYPTVEKVAEMLETSEEYKLLDYCHDRIFKKICQKSFQRKSTQLSTVLDWN